ncbi:uncharacterized protein LOC115890629 [Sitophilus oryzae]|uniref:Uncharacterized protein LOC115890629 n=1 Tax=Sitophilus oryzae TaxID=7048 RepID=A0A6J2YTZ0_SITOR|nr:uncharacterized protein LOC115890629 [Sitophilus oryzae]
MESKSEEAERINLTGSGVGGKEIRIVNREKRSEPVLSVVDILLSIFVVTPLVVASWRGLWGLMDFYGFYFPPFSIFVVGITIHVILALCQDTLHDAIIESEKHWTLKLVSHFLRRFYTYIFLIITIFHWRGGWMILDYYTNVQYTDDGVTKKENSQWILLICTGCFITLACMKGLRNATAPPYGICLDKGNFVFKFPTMFKFNAQTNTMLYLLDCLFSVAVVGNLVIFFWRGLWVVTDIIILPDNFIQSSWASLVLGLLLVGLVYRLQACMKKLCTSLKGFAKLFIADFYILLSIVSTLLFWRGVWNLLIIYFLPDNPLWSCILSHFIGLTFLLVLGCSNSMLVRGVYKDGKEPNGECVVFPCHYLRILFEEEYSYNDSSSESSVTKLYTEVETA